ncbi:uncharacterized protein LOC131211952 [Anopheles bellator]|uniref:uncharacterized protein LOC131211952 n=1 Tax=Anopheles bellator TaxID=139047 RepID=UPI002647B6F3|nr:uncharacterized protein LOC131211952 [Anopheles bellator]
MKASAFIKKKNGVETTKICRWCLSTCNALEPLANDESGQYKLQKLLDFTGLQANALPGVQSFLCTKCESRLDKMYTFRWRCNKNIALANKLNTSKNEADIGKDHLGHSAEQTVGTELLIETEVTTPDSANDLHLSCAAHQIKV